MITQYTKPIEYTPQSQYVPIPFEQLNKFTELYAKDYKETSDKLDEFVKTNSKFSSLSSADNQMYNQLTLGAIKPIIEKLGTSSDALTSAENRGLVNSTIRNIDYKTLNNLQQTATALEQEEKARMEMEANGKQIDTRFYDKNAGKDYDTYKAGKAYTAQIPVEHVPLKKVFDPLYDDIKPTFHGTVGGYDLEGISIGDLSKVTTNTNISQFLEHPVIDREVKYNEKNNLIPEKYYKHDDKGVRGELDKLSYVKDLALESQKSRIMEDKPTANQYSLLHKQQELKKKEVESNITLRSNEIKTYAEYTGANNITALNNSKDQKLKKDIAVNGLDFTSNLSPLDFQIWNSKNKTRVNQGKITGYGLDNGLSGTSLVNANDKYFSLNGKLNEPSEKLARSILNEGLISTGAILSPKNKAHSYINYTPDAKGRVTFHGIQTVDERGNKSKDLSYENGVDQSHTVYIPINTKTTDGWFGKDSKEDIISINGKQFNVNDITDSEKGIPGASVIAAGATTGGKEVKYLALNIREDAPISSNNQASATNSLYTGEIAGKGAAADQLEYTNRTSISTNTRKKAGQPK